MEIDVDMKTTAVAPTYSIKLQQLQNTFSAYQLSSALRPSLSGVLSSPRATTYILHGSLEDLCLKTVAPHRECFSHAMMPPRYSSTYYYRQSFVFIVNCQYIAMK